MKTEYNYQSFTPDEVEQGLHLEFLTTLLNYNKLSKTHYNDIHLTTDGYCFIIEWESVPYSQEYGGAFKYVGEDGIVMLERHFPDNHYELEFFEGTIGDTNCVLVEGGIGKVNAAICAAWLIAATKFSALVRQVGLALISLARTLPINPASVVVIYSSLSINISTATLLGLSRSSLSATALPGSSLLAAVLNCLKK